MLLEKAKVCFLSVIIVRMDTFFLQVWFATCTHGNQEFAVELEGLSLCRAG